MVGRTRAAAGREGARRSPARCSSRSSISAWSTSAACTMLDDVSLRAARRRDRRHRRRRRQRPVRTARGDGRHPPRRSAAADRAATASDRRRGIRPIRPRLRDLRPRPCAGGPPAPGLVLAFEAYENSILGYHELPPFSQHYLLNGPAVGAHAPGRWSASTSARACPACARRTSPAATSRRSCWRARWSSDPERAARRPADARRRYRRHRVHPRELVEMRDAGKAVLLVSVELDEILLAVRPHPGDVRRPHRRRARRRRRPRASSAC